MQLVEAPDPLPPRLRPGAQFRVAPPRVAKPPPQVRPAQRLQDAALRRQHLLDPALRRPGRFDREIAIGLPDGPGRRAIWDVYLRERPLGGDVDAGELAAMTEGWSPAAIAGAANQAARLALQRGLPVGQADLVQVVMGAAKRLA